MPQLLEELKKSPMAQKPEEQDEPKRPDYSEEEETYIANLRVRMESARNARDQDHDEFDGMSYVALYELNERLANTFLMPKRNKEDSNFQSGTIRQKIFALLSALVNLNLSGDISAFDGEGLRIQGLGDAMEDIILRTSELDGDDEKKLLRQYELLKHGTVFVEEIWDERMKKVKAYKEFTGKLKHEDWKPRLVKAFARPSRNHIPGLNVYLGDMTKYNASEQPFLFTVDTKPYEECRLIFGQWERWPSVSKKIRKLDPAEKGNVFNTDWRLLETRENFVEIVRYQDKWNNEFAVFLNGVLMTPVGLPLPWGYEDYNIAQQNLEPIHSKFAYGKSLVQRVRNKVALLDELIKLAILKSQKSAMPPSINNSGRVLSNRIFLPGKLTYGVPFDSIRPINAKETEGVTNSELAMIKEIEASINKETTSPTFSGQQAEGNPTATEIIELQRQAKMVLNITIFAMSMLEWKLEWLRLQNLIKNWFRPEDQVVDEVRNELKNRFRNVSVDRPIEGEGIGRRVVIPTNKIPSAGAIKQAEDALALEQGVPVRLLFINPEAVTSSKLLWQIAIRPKEKQTSETSKLLFRAYVQDIQLFGPRVNIQNLEEKFASAWGEDPRKAFLPEEIVPPALEAGGAGAQQAGRGAVSPRVNLPTAESALNRQTASALKQ